MAVTTTITQAELSRVMAAAYTGEVITAALVDAASAPDVDDSIAEWLQYEKLEQDGYVRFQSSALGAGSYDNVDARWEQSPVTISFTANGGSLYYTHLVVMIGADADAFVGTGLTASTDVDPSTDELTVTAHGLTDGDKVSISTMTGTLPAGLSANTIYYANSLTANTFSLHTATPVSPSNLVNITSTGSGTLFVHRCNGSVHSIIAEAGGVVILDGETKNYQLTIATDD